MLCTGARILLESLKREGVDLFFGYPGGAVIDIYDELSNHPDLRHILVRHEQGAVHAADGYARACGKGWGLSRYVRPRCDQYCDRGLLRPTAIPPHGYFLRGGVHAAQLGMTFSGSGYHRDHPPLYETQLFGQRRQRFGRDCQEGLLSGAFWTPRACACRHS